MTVPESSIGNIQQRVWDKIPLYPVPISVAGLYAALPNLAEGSVRRAVAALVARCLVEPVVGTKFSYRRVEAATRPDDERGGARPGTGGARPGSGRKKATTTEESNR